jgi:hypothetical protein
MLYIGSMRILPLLAACSLSLVAGCGDDSGDGGPSFACSSVPACHTDAVAALRACISAPALTLMPVGAMSGVVTGLTCRTAPTSVAFSPFSSSPTGTVPLPSTVTITSGGAFCAELTSGNGTRTDNTGAAVTYELSTIRAGAGAEISVETYADGTIRMNCSPPSTREEVVASAGALDSCPGSVMAHEVVRNANFTHMGVDLLDVSAARTTLFACD